MSNLRLNKIKSNVPISVLVNGANRIGSLVAKSLVDQGSYVIIVDKFNSETKEYISDLKKSDLVDFFDFKGYESLFKTLKRFDYLFYFLNERLETVEFDSKSFLQETKYLEQSLTATKKFKAKFSLITSLELNRELANRTNISELAKPSPYSNVELQKYCETMVAEFCDRTKSNIRIIRLGTVIGKGIKKINSEVLDALFIDSSQHAQITIKGEGLDVHNLIHESDAVYGILKLTFLDNTKGEVITLSNKNNYTTLSLAYKLLELNTNAESIRFVDNPDDKFVVRDIYVPAPYATKFGWTQQITLEEAMIEQMQVYYDNIDKSWNVSLDTPTKKDKPTVKVTKTKMGAFFSDLFYPITHLFAKEEDSKKTRLGILKGAFITVVVCVATYFLIYPIVGTFISYKVIEKKIANLSTSVFDNDADESKEQLSVVSTNIRKISDNVTQLHWLFKVTKQNKLYDTLTELVYVGENAVDGAIKLVDATYPLVSYIKDFEPAVSFDGTGTKTTREYREYLKKMSEGNNLLYDAQYKILAASSIYRGIDVDVIPVEKVREKINSLGTALESLYEGTTAYKEALSFLPDLLGEKKRMTYLVLLQNESEIRSTGGWLTSYGIIGLEGGQIRELKIDDIYNADGVLKSQRVDIDMPKDMVEVLDLEGSSFSLVNWSPDLSETMSLAGDFTSALHYGEIDGVVTIDVGFLQKLLDKWGGIELPGGTEIITSANIYSKIFDMHESFEPGSTQKTTFLSDLCDEIIHKLLSMNINEMITLSDVLVDSLNEKHLQATFVNADAYNFFKTRNWACALDYAEYNSVPVSIDWNWGGNKANLYINKSYTLLAEIVNEDSLYFTYTVDVENKSTTNNYPEGDYINYERIYLPENASVDTVVGFTNNSYTTYKENGFRVVAGWFNTKIQKDSTIVVKYSLNRGDLEIGFPISKNDNEVTLSLNLFKQAGEKNSAYKLDIVYPTQWRVLDASTLSNLSNISSQLTSKFSFLGDTSYKVIFEKPN